MTFWLVCSFCLWMFLLAFFFSFFFFDWIILHNFQGGKPAAGTNFPDYLIFPPSPKQLPFPMFPHKKQPCQLSPGPPPCQAVWRGRPWAKQAAGWAGWAPTEVGVRRPLICPLFTEQKCHSIFCLAFFLEVEKLFWIPLTSASGSFSSRKSKSSSELWALCLGAVILRGTCLPLKDYSS